MSKPFILVTGFHRSGTSLIAQTLQNNGVWMGKNLMGAGHGNTKGHIEDLDLVNIHDLFLKFNNTSWQHIGDNALQAPSILKKRLSEYIDYRLDDDSQWVGAKDPRAIYFQPVWNELLGEKLKTLLVYRDWRFCISSLYKRHVGDLSHFSQPAIARPVDANFWLHPDLAISMWITAAEATIKWASNNPNAIVVDADDLSLKGSDYSSQLAALGLPKTLLQNSSFDSTMQQSSIFASAIDMVSDEKRNKAEQCLKSLRMLSSSSGNLSITIDKSHPLTSEWLNKHALKPVDSETEEQIDLPIDIGDLTFEEIDKYLSGSNAPQSIDWSSVLAKPKMGSLDADAMFRHAFKRRDLKEAEIFAHRALAIYQTPIRWLQLGDVYLKRSLCEDAKRCYQNASEMAPENATFFARLVDVEMQQNNEREARNYLQKAVLLEPDKPIVKAISETFERWISNKDIKLEGTSKASFIESPFMPVISSYEEVMLAYDKSEESGKLLDNYMEKLAFCLRDNFRWLQEFVSLLPEQSGRCFCDYWFARLSKHWSVETIRYAFKVEQFSIEDAACLLEKIFNKPIANEKIGVHIHAYYIDLLPEILSFLTNLPTRPKLVLTCKAENAIDLRNLTNNYDVEIIEVKNEGRDVLPWLRDATPLLRECDLALKLHTKSTPHAKKLIGWRTSLLWSLLESEETVSNIISMFQSDHSLGVLLPRYHPNLKGDISWGENFEIAKSLFKESGKELPNQVSIFPAGNMFWYRPNALKFEWNKSLAEEDFPEEKSQIDGTIMHAIERLITLESKRNGFSSQFIIHEAFL